MPVVLDRADVGGRPELDAGGNAGDVVVPPDEAAQPLWQRVDEAFAGDDGGTTIRAPSPRSSQKQSAHGMPEPSKALCRTW